MDSYSDMELVERSQGGDEAAFEQLVNRHYPTVYRVSYKWCGVKEDAEDITQEVFVKLARKLRMFGRRSSFSTWLYRVTINTAKDFIRKHHTKRRYDAAFEQDAGNPSQVSEEALEAGRLYRLLDQLPEKQKASILLVFAEGRNHKEAAEILGCSETTVSWRIFQARKKLKTFIGREI
jgi:RNA polymerase sigma-70 factor, ECF subfamily